MSDKATSEPPLEGLNNSMFTPLAASRAFLLLARFWLEKPVRREKTRLTSPEVRAAAASKS